MSDIVTALVDRSSGMSESERVRYVYNQAVDDAANFLRDLAPHNPMQATVLLSAERELRRLTLSKEQPAGGSK